jgi:hypothetical protein
MQASFHQELAFALVHQLNGALSRAVAVRSVNDLKTANLDPMLFGDFVDLGRRSDEDWPDDSKVGRLNGASKRSFIAWMDDNGRGGRDLLGPSNQVLVFGFRWMGRWTYGLKRADFTFTFSWHAGTLSFRIRGG